MQIRSLAALAGGIVLASGGAAFAQPGDSYAPQYAPSVQELVVRAPFAPAGVQVRYEPVSFADLDLSNEAGAYTLLGRISAAAKRVCSPAPSLITELKNMADYRGCLRGAMDRAVYDLDEPSVNYLYTGSAQPIAYGY